jgi:hypothetical protein
VDAVQPARIIVTIAAQSILAAIGARELVPFLAGHLAGFAADANGGVGVKTHGLGHDDSLV